MRGESSANGRNTFKIYVNETITFSFPRNYLSKTARILIVLDIVNLMHERSM